MGALKPSRNAGVGHGRREKTGLGRGGRVLCGVGGGGVRRGLGEARGELP